MSLVGALAICAGLWATGNLQNIRAGALRRVSRSPRPVRTQPATLPDVNSVAIRLPSAAVDPPPGR